MSERTTLTAPAEARAAVAAKMGLDEAELGRLPARVATGALGLAQTNPAAARQYVEGHRDQANAEGAAPPVRQATTPAQPRRPVGKVRPLELTAKSIKLTLVVDAAALAAVTVPDGVRPSIVVSAAGRRLTGDLNPKSLKKAVATIAEHGAENVAVVLQGKLGPGDAIEECGIAAQVKGPKPS